MTSRDFAFWLQGFIELTPESELATDGLKAWQVDKIKKHLNLVFKHEIDPSMGPPHHQDALSAIHAAHGNGGTGGSLGGDTLLRC